MARFYPVSPLFWTDRKVLTWGEQTRYLALYLLTTEHRNLEGLYRLPLAYIQADLNWSRETVDQQMSHLIDDGFVKYDADTSVVFLPNALKYHQPGSANQLQGAINALQQVPDTTLWGEFLDAAMENSPRLYERLTSDQDT